MVDDKIGNQFKVTFFIKPGKWITLCCTLKQHYNITNKNLKFKIAQNIIKMLSCIKETSIEILRLIFL